MNTAWVCKNQCNRQYGFLPRTTRHKTVPTISLLDLGRRGLCVPPEIQMLIMLYKEIAEMRHKMTAILIEDSILLMCKKLIIPQNLRLAGEWKQVAFQNYLVCRINSSCHNCKRYFEHALSIDMMAEGSNRMVNLDRLYSACAQFTIRWYQDHTLVERIGEMLVHSSTTRSPRYCQESLGFCCTYDGRSKTHDYIGKRTRCFVSGFT